MLGDCLITAQSMYTPCTSGLGISQGFQRGERLGGDNKEGLSWIEVTGGLDKRGAVNVRNKAHSQLAITVVAQGVVGHRRAEVGPTNADVDHSANALPSVPSP